MADITIKMDDAAFQLNIARMLAEVRGGAHKLETKFRQIVMRVTSDAVRKAPVLWGALHDSGQYRIEGATGASSIFTQATGARLAFDQTEGSGPSQMSGQGLMGTITFGGMAEAYAEVQHEHDEFVHPKGGQSHFLYGSSTSAWNPESESFAMKTLENQARRSLGEAWGE